MGAYGTAVIVFNKPETPYCARIYCRETLVSATSTSVKSPYHQCALSLRSFPGDARMPECRFTLRPSRGTISQHSNMPAKKRSLADPNESGKLDVYRDLEERVLKDTPANGADSNGVLGRSIIEAALAAHDTPLLRSIAAERRGLTDQQRQALLLVADLLDRTVDKRGGSR